MKLKRLTCLVALSAALPAFAGSLIISGEVPGEKTANKDVASTSAGTATAAVAAPVLPVTFELGKGKRVDEQLRAYAKSAGWDLIWQAPDYVLDRSMTLQGDFEASLLGFLKGANEAGSRLRAVFYRGNKTVRVTEF